MLLLFVQSLFVSHLGPKTRLCEMFLAEFWEIKLGNTKNVLLTYWKTLLRVQYQQKCNFHSHEMWWGHRIVSSRSQWLNESSRGHIFNNCPLKVVKLKPQRVSLNVNIWMFSYFLLQIQSLGLILLTFEASNISRIRFGVTFVVFSCEKSIFRSRKTSVHRCL